ncbi:MAG: PP2C family protein-serine/threonine phosphatase [Myxococcaceae bacterium]
MAPSAAVQSPRTRFEEYRDALTHDWLKTLTALGFTLVPLFLILDYFTMPAQLRERFMWYRGGATALMLVQHFWVRRTPPSRYSVIHGYLFSFVATAMIVQMTVDLGGFDSAYYAGLNLVIVAVNVLLPWRAIHSAINAFITISWYVIANLAFSGEYHAATLVNNLYFMGATGVIAVAISATKYRLIEQEFHLRAELLLANESLDRSRSELKAARDALWGEMEVAKRIQTALLPQNRILGAYEVSALMQPAAEVGGDYYDFFETRRGEQWVAIGDVSGHGVESGLVMMMTQTSIVSMVNERSDQKPSDVFRSVNFVLRESIGRLQTSRYMTLNVIRLNADALTIAGKHQDVLVFRKASGKVDQISNEGCWIGVVPDTKGYVDDLQLELSSGDVVLLYTDGATEATNSSGEMFGERRLAEVLQRVASLPLERALLEINKAVASYQQSQEDDVTLMLLRKR